MAPKVQSRARQAEVIDLPQVSEDERLAKSEGLSLTEWFRGLAVFFKRAGEIEQAARVTLARAKALKPPTTMEEDAEIQLFVKGASAERRDAEDHWDITSKFSRFHKRLVAGRTRATELLEEAAAIGNRLHNGYTEAERRRVQAETDRKRREAEEQARKDREREQAEAEAQALAAEEANADLSNREKAFVEEYVCGIGARGDGQASAVRAGFKDPFKSAARLLALPKIQGAIKGRLDAIAIREQAAARREEPLHVDVEPVKAQISRASGAHDRTTWGYEVYDEEAFMAALMEPRTRLQLGIPADIGTYKPAKMTENARSLQDRINTWPGVRAVRTTKVV